MKAPFLKAVREAVKNLRDCLHITSAKFSWFSDSPPTPPSAMVSIEAEIV